MLKIKDTVDLKKLEKFGFEKVENCYGLIEMRKKENDYVTICIEPSRNIYLMIDRIGMSFAIDYEIEVIFDFIQAGLVEKVDE